MNTPTIQNKITLSKILVKSVKLETDSIDPNASNDLNFSLKNLVLIPENESNKFLIEFVAEFKNKEGRIAFELLVKLTAVFETDSPITEEFKKSHFIFVNAPAIAFPFLRSFVATVISNAGYNVFLLNSVNFSTLYDQQMKR